MYVVTGVFPLLNVSNVDKSLEFYKALGLKTKKESMGPMTWGSVFSGSASFELFPKNDIAPDQAPDTRAWLAGDLGRGVVINVGVANAAATFQKAKSFGAEIDEPLTDAPWGGKMFMVVDPDGYVIAFQDKIPGAAPSSSATKKSNRRKVKPAKAKGKSKPKRKGK